VRQDGQPLAQQRVDLRRTQDAADGLQDGHVIDGGEPVVQRLEADPALAACRLAHSLPLTHSLALNGKQEQNLMKNGPKSSSVQ